MPIRYVPTRAFHGFDANTSPKWQTVPLGGCRVLTVAGQGSLVPRVSPPDIASVTLARSGTAHRLTIDGTKAGCGQVEWVPNAGCSGTVPDDRLLEISVKAQRRVRTVFHYVQDNAGHRTARCVDDIDVLVAGVNAILTPQANVVMEKKSAREITVPQNLGTVVRFVGKDLRRAPYNVPGAAHEWDDVTAFADAAADFNVFFVWEYEQDATPGRDNTNAGTLAAEKNGLMEDVLSVDAAIVLAHETVHRLGIRGHSGPRSHLMARGGAGPFLTRDQIDTINTSGT